MMTRGKGVLSHLTHLGPTGGMGRKGKEREKEEILEREALPSL